MKKLLISVCLLLSTHVVHASVGQVDMPVVTAEKFLEYKKANGHMGAITPPKIVLVCYQQSLLEVLLHQHPEAVTSKSFSNLYFVHEGQTGILGGWGIGAPALANKMEQLIALGVKKFIAVGTAGTLMLSHKIGDFVLSPEALAEDGVSHLYLPEGTRFAKADQKMVKIWKEFAVKQALPSFHTIPTWSFSAIFRETPRAIKRATSLGCGVVEMEAATLYAIGQDKNVETLSLFVISDSVTEEEWTPHIKEPLVENNLHQLATWALLFCEGQCKN